MIESRAWKMRDNFPKSVYHTRGWMMDIASKTIKGRLPFDAMLWGLCKKSAFSVHIFTPKKCQTGDGWTKRGLATQEKGDRKPRKPSPPLALSSQRDRERVHNREWVRSVKRRHSREPVLVQTGSTLSDVWSEHELRTFCFCFEKKVFGWRKKKV